MQQTQQDLNTATETEVKTAPNPAKGMIRFCANSLKEISNDINMAHTKPCRYNRNMQRKLENNLIRLANIIAFMEGTNPSASITIGGYTITPVDIINQAKKLKTQTHNKLYGLNGVLIKEESEI